MAQQLKKTEKLLMLPVIVWGATFTFGTVWLFILMSIEKDPYVTDVLIYTLLTVISINIATIALVFIASYYHEKYKKELQSRIFLMLTNIPVAALYFALICRFSKFLN